MEIELVGGAVQEGGYRRPWERTAMVILVPSPVPIPTLLGTNSYLAALFLLPVDILIPGTPGLPPPRSNPPNDKCQVDNAPGKGNHG